MTICPKCGAPEVAHIGHDHKANRCLVATTRLELSLRYGWEKAGEVVRMLNAWHDQENTEVTS